jgi:hypothetical protein
MARRSPSFLLVSAALLVCVSLLHAESVSAQSQSDPSPNYATQPYTPRDFQLPEGGGCSGDVARWQAIQENDYRSGNIGLPVYHRIQGEIAQAAAACSAGHDAQASAMVRSSKARHGYPQ